MTNNSGSPGTGTPGGGLDGKSESPKEPRAPSNYTSNDLLFSLKGKKPAGSLNYRTIAQTADEVQDIQNAPAVSMGPYLLSAGQTSLLNTISIYSQRGENREQVRLLYMNSVALSIWKDMGRNPRVLESRHRPPATALLAFGVPFSD